MLFSNPEVAAFIDNTFEPVWVSVRPAPIITIDFGNDHKIIRTLQGNVATYICDAEGTVHDVLPGIYTPGPYRVQLTLLAALVKELASLSATERLTRLKAYHIKGSTALNRPVAAKVAAVARMGGAGKGGGFGGGGGGGFGGGQGGFGGGAPVFSGIEGPLEAVLVGRPVVPATPPGGDLSLRADLAFDVIVNENVRRKLVHDQLAALGLIRPDNIKQWLFRVVLKADIDDPHLGLGPVLNAGYPFGDEDQNAVTAAKPGT